MDNGKNVYKNVTSKEIVRVSDFSSGVVHTYFDMLPTGSLKKRLLLTFNSKCKVRTVNNITPVTTPGKPLTILTQSDFTLLSTNEEEKNCNFDQKVCP